jgi:acyl-CoA thioesterase-1
VINTSISGDTTRGALKRLDSILERHRPDVVIIELGGNDGLRGLSLEEMRENFSAIIEKSREGHAKVLLIRMRIPTNYGPVYVRQFEKLFDDLIREYAIHDAPFILRGIAERPELMQADGIHPRAEAQTLMLDNIWSSLVPLL